MNVSTNKQQENESIDELARLKRFAKHRNFTDIEQRWTLATSRSDDAGFDDAKRKCRKFVAHVKQEQISRRRPVPDAKSALLTFW